MEERTPSELAADPLLETAPRFSLLWLIPLIAAVVAGWLAWQTLSERGPLITITFSSAEGIVAGQTRVKHKAVDLGEVRSVRLTPDMKRVVVEVRMRREAASLLTDHARFWVVRPRFTAGSFSGLETLVSGSYIEIDPGTPGGAARRAFTGLEAPPAVRSDEPGRTFRLHAARLGALGVGSPVLFRDATVGEVIGYELGGPGKETLIRVFIRAPYADFVHQGSYFWNDSGFSVNMAGGGLRLEFQSVQALLSGAIAFDTPEEAEGRPLAANDADFTLYPDHAAATTARYADSIPILVHFRGSVRGLSVGAPVEIYGIQIGEVTDVKLQYDFEHKQLDVPVRLIVQPGRISAPNAPPPTLERAIESLKELTAQGLRAQLRTGNYLTGQLYVAFDFFPDAKPASITVEDGTIVVPSEPSDLENMAMLVSTLEKKLASLPIEDIVNNLDATLRGLNKIANGPELAATLKEASVTLATVQRMTKTADQGLARLPAISAELEASLQRANHLLAGLEASYGNASPLPRDLERVLAEMDEAARSIRSLADLLDQHPEALIRGRAGPVQER
jgi:paraquat-inducible protein B